ncbi:MAG: folylpolyglutamate synthase/dihydrofolate synthase family protein [Pseudomonadota bacterium]
MTDSFAPPHSDALLERMMQLHPKLIDLTLDRMWRILDAMGNPQDHVPPVVHVAGTNGKGSTLAMIRAGLEGAGEKVHVYTSPHLVRFHERIRLAGTLIEEEELSVILDDCLTANGATPITYFEITTAAAFQAFATRQANWTLLETGMGGRLDSTNVISKPALTLITPVDLDHQRFLGETLEEIAGEKAGILKPGVPCIVARQNDRALAVIEAKAARLRAPLFVQDADWHVMEEHGRLVFQDETGLLDLPLPVLAGPHQIDNAGMALMALRALGTGDPDAAMQHAKWPARMQRLRRGPMLDAAPQAEFWLDGGHNPHAAAALAATLRTLPKRPTHMIVGLQNTKDAEGYLRHLAPLAQTLHTVTIPGQPATLSAEETAIAARNAGIEAEIAPDVAAAVSRIVAGNASARLLICGSLYLAGDILKTHG